MADLIPIWREAQKQIKERLGATIFETWILPLKIKAQNQETILLEAPDTFFRDWVQKNYSAILEDSFHSLGLTGVRVELIAGPGLSATGDRQAPAKSPVNLPRSSQPILNLNSRYTFENFIIGPSNRHAHAYSLAVANALAKTYNPLFIYGGVGLGKTHLIQAICHQIIDNFAKDIKIAYLPSEQFTNELINAIQHHSTAAFRQKYRNADVLVIDDVHFFGGKDSTQEEFFNTFNALYDAHKQIILSSDRPPKEIADLQDRLVSRFGWGLTTDIQPPDLETRVAILKKKIEREPVSVPDEVIFFIAQLIKTNIRELEGALIRTMAYSLMEERPITLDLTKEVLKDLLREPKKLITVDFIQRCVAEEFGIALGELKTKRRNKTVVLPRQIAMYLSRELTDLSLPEIGQFFGGKDHTTVLHSFNKIKEGVTNNTTLQEKVERIIQTIKQ
ncbi:MAG: chromosomal replication initiator protein DnaA [Candidatus Omnitrophica bacterium]|nr:chromosomal replication initiator protein DnaA [Candidatus Omnitrophota bacterium]MDD5027664.1 chromosomal replication initiator protein DnaA [Candidatus Omnitrophota bacterium]MDD5661579.1 chromosomal replication initiator protein DnaA [Candidatus Omnitrophota bacterium]